MFPIPKGRENESQAQSMRNMTLMDLVTNEELDSTNPEIMNGSRIAQGSQRNDCEVEEMLEENKRRAKILSKIKALNIPKKREISALPRNVTVQQLSKVLPPQRLKQICEMAPKFDGSKWVHDGNVWRWDK